MLDMIKHVIFPILQYTEADEQLWEDDPKEYIRTKYGMSMFEMVHIIGRENNFEFSILDIYDDYSTSVPSAQELFFTSCKIRKGILQESMEFLMTVSYTHTTTIS